MLNTLDDIVTRLVEEYDPDRIILFGSRARGGTDPESDIDLVVLKETEERPLERRQRLEKLLADRRVPLDLLVYTPAEFCRLYLLGSPLVEEVVEEGRLLYMRKATEAWLADAREELETARVLLEHKRLRGVCLHAQQCAEKVLKALLLEKGRRPPRTHDLIELLTVAREAGWTVEMDGDSAAFLNSVYRGRYPTAEGLLPYGEPTESDAGKAFGAAEALLAHASLLPSPAPSS